MPNTDDEAKRAGVNKTIARNIMETDLIRIGLTEGDVVYVHSSMKKVGWIEGGIKELVGCFINVLGTEGTLAVPTHTYSFIGRSVPPFNRDESNSETGAFSEAVRIYPGARRSGNASHSSAAVGKYAEYLTATHDSANPVGYDSPLYRIYCMGGKVMLIGVTQSANTMLHLAEFLSGVQYTLLHYDDSYGDKTREYRGDMTVKENLQVKYNGCSSKFNLINDYLIRGSALRQGKVGNADSFLMDAGYMVDTAVRLIREKPDFFLCENEKCPCCPKRRKYLQDCLSDKL